MHSTVEFNKKMKRWEMITWVNLGDGIHISSAVVPLNASTRRGALTEMHKVKISLAKMADLDSDALYLGSNLKDSVCAARK